MGWRAKAVLSNRRGRVSDDLPPQQRAVEQFDAQDADEATARFRGLLS
jgi:hypothetical protein